MQTIPSLLKRQTGSDSDIILGTRALTERRREAARDAARRALSHAHLGQDNIAFHVSLEEYRVSIRRLCELFPNLSRWQVERDVLPEEFRSPQLSILGLPETRLPFSLYGGWENPVLEGLIPEYIVDDGGKGSLAMMISRMLDRFVESGFPLEEISPFFRPAVARLHECDVGGTGYAHEVIASACELAEQYCSTYIAGKSNHLKRSIHKNIPTTTGVPLSENTPSHPISKKPPRGGGVTRFLRGSAALRLGIDPFSCNLPPRLTLKPASEILAEPPKGKEICVNALLSNMGTVLRIGSETKYTHPGLLGMEFTKAECERAAASASTAYQMVCEPTGKGLAIDDTSGALSSSDAFREACGSSDGASIMRLALERGAIEARAAHLASKYGVPKPLEQAEMDLEAAFAYIEEYQNFPDKPSEALRSVRRMRQLSNMGGNMDKTPYELALLALDERMDKNEVSKTLIPERTSVPPEHQTPIPRPSPIPVDLLAPQEDAEPAWGIDVDDKSALPLAQALLDVVLPEEAPESADGITDDITIDVAEPEDGPAEQEDAPEPETKPRGAPLPDFDFPFSNAVYDSDLEKILPLKTGPDGSPDERATLVRRVARALVTYKLHGFDDANIDGRCLGAVRLLRAEYSPAAVLEYANAIVDGKGPEAGEAAIYQEAEAGLAA